MKKEIKSAKGTPIPFYLQPPFPEVLDLPLKLHKGKNPIKTVQARSDKEIFV